MKCESETESNETITRNNYISKPNQIIVKHFPLDLDLLKNLLDTFVRLTPVERERERRKTLILIHVISTYN